MLVKIATNELNAFGKYIDSGKYRPPATNIVGFARQMIGSGQQMIASGIDLSCQ